MRTKLKNGRFFQEQLRKNEDFKFGLIEIDFLARRYNLNPVDIFYPECDNLFLKLAYMRKIAEVSVEHEANQMEEAEQQAEQEAIRKEMEAKIAEQQRR